MELILMEISLFMDGILKFLIKKIDIKFQLFFGNFTLFITYVFTVGGKGIEYRHFRIIKGNEIYAYYADSLTKEKTLIIKNNR